MVLLQLSAVAMVLTAAAHSIVGEKRLIGPLLARNIDILAGYRGPLVRFAWHYTSILMLVSALLTVWPGTPSAVIRLTGAAWLFAGLFDAVVTRFKHIGWPLLSAAGLLAIAGTYL